MVVAVSDPHVCPCIGSARGSVELNQMFYISPEQMEKIVYMGGESCHAHTLKLKAVIVHLPRKECDEVMGGNLIGPWCGLWPSPGH